MHLEPPLGVWWLLVVGLATRHCRVHSLEVGRRALRRRFLVSATHHCHAHFLHVVQLLVTGNKRYKEEKTYLMRLAVVEATVNYKQ